MDHAEASVAKRLGLPEGSLHALRRVTFDEVVAALTAARAPERGSGPWTLRMLQRADDQCRGHWFACSLRGDALLRVHLPRHAGEPCHGDRRELVPAGGMPVAEAAGVLAAWDEAARQESQECWRRLTVACRNP